MMLPAPEPDYRDYDDYTAYYDAYLEWARAQFQVEQPNNDHDWTFEDFKSDHPAVLTAAWLKNREELARERAIEHYYGRDIP